MPLLNFLRNLSEFYEFIRTICLSYTFIKNTSNKNTVKHILRSFDLEESLDVNNKKSAKHHFMWLSSTSMKILFQGF